MRPWHLMKLACLYLSTFAFTSSGAERPALPDRTAEAPYENIERRLIPISTELGRPKPGDWLYEHKEAGQTFVEYVKSKPVRRSSQLDTIYICVIGNLSDDQKQIIETTREYLEIVFDTPVKIGDSVPLSAIPQKAQRTHPQWGGEQILSTYVLNDLLKPSRPEDALASLAFTASDLWPGPGWNFVFGQASLRERTGVWSIHRNGDPSRDAASYKLCLERTLGTASHETSHILSMPHCKKYECSLNGSNGHEESDGKPLHLCPVCLRKLCWNLQVDPIQYLGKQEKFCRKYEFKNDAEWYRQAISLLQKDRK